MYFIQANTKNYVIQYKILYSKKNPFTKLLENKNDLGFGNGFLHMTLKAQGTKENI